MNSANHSICRYCKHRAGDVLPCQDAWCNMFLSGRHLNLTGTCGQFNQDPSQLSEELQGLKTMDIVHRLVSNTPNGTQRWEWVRQTLGYGSTISVELCRVSGFDPYVVSGV